MPEKGEVLIPEECGSSPLLRYHLCMASCTIEHASMEHDCKYITGVNLLLPIFAALISDIAGQGESSEDMEIQTVFIIH